ncbi:ERF family protein [Staphylococcus warneri]|uniref:ERF family protein n=1 Tax=Staphylococcus warneri TaxID=1292 RepID=UPI000D1D2EFF|nr:ERF family protein [Staphylococcus warneri]AXZ23727.1 single-stranded DNA-binding protein [Staphylococcus warneri]AXZ23792.1 single-stranded DNA-binding protein [Staphylococcus warneri]MCJ1787170.1 ERF family protein [Staphylococcus warneri]MCJ1799467.1 ERF family protein [Staphylococcus warneri]PTI07201.1 single-stranded DNA-binding protein [Staphylococcus warneri]
MTEQLNLYQKIADVKANIDGFTKDTKGYNYSYVSGSQVLHRIRNKMIEHNLLLVPYTEHEEVTETKNAKGKPEHIVKLKLTYKWINADKPQEILEVPFFAIGQQDDVSKAHGTALTYAERYFLMKFFNIPTDEDDADAKQKQDKYSTSNTQLQDYLRKEANDFIAIAKESGLADKYQEQINKLEKMNVSELNKQQINVTRQQIKKWLGGIE